MLTDGRELARFTGPGARSNALRYVVNGNPARRRPDLDQVRRMRDARGRDPGSHRI
jgi:hypothetical protein